MRLAVVITSSNDELTIKRSVESALLVKNKLEGWDTTILIVDDASTDNTIKIELDCIDKYSFISLKQFSERGGVSRSRNFGIDSNLSSNYILFLDADDELDPKLADYLNKGRLESDFYGFDFSIITNGNAKLIKHMSASTVFNSTSITNYFFRYLTTPNKQRLFISCWAKLFKTNIFHENNIRFKESMNIYEDAELVFRFMRHANSIEYVDTPTYKYHVPNIDLSNRASFGVNWDASHLFSFIVALRQLQFYLIEIGNDASDVRNRVAHCMGAYTCISSVRAWIRVRNLADFLNTLGCLKKIYNRTIIKQCAKAYDARVAEGNRLAAFFLKCEFFNIAAILLFLVSKKRYGL